MNRKVKDLRKGMRLDLQKPPKVEIPKNVYNRKVKHKKGLNSESSAPFFYSMRGKESAFCKCLYIPRNQGLPGNSESFKTANSCIKITLESVK